MSSERADTMELSRLGGGDTEAYPHSVLDKTVSSNPTDDHTLPSRPWRLHTTPWSAIISTPYPGEGTYASPYIVNWVPSDPSRGFKDRENPLTFFYWYKWVVTMIGAFATLGVTMASSMLSAAVWELRTVVFPGHTDQVYIMVTSGFVVGFVIGPIIWAPCSELRGRRITYIVSCIPFVAFNAACCGAKSMAALIVLRVFAGTFGSSAMVNSGGIIADMFEAHQRGLAMGIFAAAPFLGPSIGPVAGGFLSDGAGWEWVAALIAFVTLVIGIVGCIWLPETYAPVILRARAARLSKVTGKKYVSHFDASSGTKPSRKQQMTMPWILLAKEPIVLLTALYLSIIYAILYMQFTSFPLVFQVARGWSPGIAGLAFFSITIGAILALSLIIFYVNPLYARNLKKEGGYLPPEARLPSGILGAVLLPAGLFWFAWTGTPVSIHWIVPVIGSVLIGAGIVLVFLSIMNYLVDAYLIYAASVIGGGTIIRSIFGVVFPLFTTIMYKNLGIHWAGSLIAFLALAFTPAPIVFYIYGRRIRRASKFARQADDIGQVMAKKALAAQRQSTDSSAGGAGGVSGATSAGEVTVVEDQREGEHAAEDGGRLEEEMIGENGDLGEKRT
ncbi:hypothetical protein IAT38_003691 [Cryptococcus sp. DSM 104549]